MKTIWKYNLAITDQQVKNIPGDFEILSVQCQRGKLCVWVLVDPESPLVGRLFEIIGTGHSVEEYKRTFIDTFQLSEGDLVFHVFLREPTP